MVTMSPFSFLTPVSDAIRYKSWGETLLNFQRNTKALFLHT